MEFGVSNEMTLKGDQLNVTVFGQKSPPPLSRCSGIMGMSHDMGRKHEERAENELVDHYLLPLFTHKSVCVHIHVMSP